MEVHGVLRHPGWATVGAAGTGVVGVRNRPGVLWGVLRGWEYSRHRLTRLGQVHALQEVAVRVGGVGVAAHAPGHIRLVLGLLAPVECACGKVRVRRAGVAVGWAGGGGRSVFASAA